MNPNDPALAQVLRALQERAKELNCLYQIHELLKRLDDPLDETLRKVIQVVPCGLQFPEVCQVKLTLESSVYRTGPFEETPWVLGATIGWTERTFGSIEVYYTESRPAADEGPFLKEERKLLNLIADHITHHLTLRRLRKLAESQPVEPSGPEESHPEWWVIVDFLRRTDHHLLMRLSRKMINYLCWSGVDEAHELLRRFARAESQGGRILDENRPVGKATLEDLLNVPDETFRIAPRYLSEGEILACIQKWIQDDKATFLIETLENMGASITDIADAIQQFQHLGVEESELSRAAQNALRVSLVSRIFTDELDSANVAKDYVEVRDFYEPIQHIICPPKGYGKLGGKSWGLFLAHQVIRKSTEYASLLSGIRVPRTWYITSDGLLNFLQYNHLEDVLNRKYLEIDQIRREYPHLIQLFKYSRVSPEIMKGLSLALDDLEGRPLIVRSSSLLEDRTGTAFSGKYKSLFLANQGSKQERLAALMDAIGEVYASTFGPDPIEYRIERGLVDLREEMGIMIQEVVGARVGDYFLPSYSGVAFSNNEFRWSPRIKREDGLLRLVPGLGTRAVDRLADDYPVLIAPGQPGLRVNVSPDEILRYSPRMVDVINLRTRAFESVEIRKLLRECGDRYPLINRLVSIWDDGVLRPPLGSRIDFEKEELVFTFEGLVTQTPFIAQMRVLLSLLREKLGAPVDIEFACDGEAFYLLQCRIQSFARDTAPAPIPPEIPPEKLLFTAQRHVSNGRVPDITHVVFVDPRGYARLERQVDLVDVGRAVGKLNKILPRRQFILMGPGRWGSRGDIRLGVSVTYSDINNAAMLVEIARREGNYVPDLSFGTHFFQDLVEASIRYLPLYPDEPGAVFNEEFLEKAPNLLPDLLPDYAHLSDVVRVIDVPAATGGQILRVLMNAELDHAVGMLAPPTRADPRGGREYDPLRGGIYPRIG
jgi:pyruvate,water dikinase